MLVVIPLVALALGFGWWLSSGRYVSTDNAYVGADKSLITPQVTGAITAVHVTEGQKVKVGDPLFDIDPQPYEIALALAKGRVEAAKVEFANLKSSYVSNADQIKMGEDAVAVRQTDFDRKNGLAAHGTGPRADRDTSMGNLIQAKQILEFVRQQQATVTVKLGGGPDASIENFPDYMQAKAGLEDAERNLRNTKVVAPIDGVATQVPEIQVGRVAAGRPAGVRDRRQHRPLGRRQSEGIGPDLRPCRPAGDGERRHVPRPGMEGLDLLDRAGDGRAIRDPAGAERDRQLGQGRPARAASVLLRSEGGYDRPASGHECLSYDRHRPRAHACRDARRAQAVGRRLRRHPPRREDGRHQMNAAVPAPPLYETISPTLRWLLTVCIMMATIMQALDTTIANVALPYMQGSLSTTQDQINWVLTSYIVAAAIMTSPLGWMATRFGRKKLFIVCTAGFTVASMLCGVALSIEQMVAYRLLQGVFGAALVPLSPGGDARHFSARPARLGDGDLGHGRDARADHGADARRLSHQFLFLALGVLRQPAVRHPHHRRTVALHERNPDPARRALLLVRLPQPVARHRIAADDARPRRAARLVRFDRDHRRGDPCRSSASISFSPTASPSKRPFITVRIFRDWNFSIALVFMFLIGIILLATMALVTPFIQNMLGYPVLSSGYLLGTRGIGTFVAMFLVGRLSGKVDARLLIFIGLVLATSSLWLMVGWSLDVPASVIAINSVAQGFGLGFIFVPLNTIAFASLPGELRTEGAALWTLIRNIGSAVGISIVIARLTSSITMFHSQLVEHVTPFNDAMRMPNASMLSGHGLPSLAMLEGLITQQAAAMAYSNDFLFMTFISLCAFPLLALIRSPKAVAAAASREAAAHAVMD